MATEVTYWIIQCLTKWQSQEPFSTANTDLPGPLQVIEAQERMGWIAFFEACISVEWASIQQAHFLWLGRRNTGKCWGTLMVVKLWEIAWDLWDHCNHHNQIKHNNETAQYLACRNSILLAVRAEYAFGHSGLPRRNWHLFQCLLLSILASSLYYLDAWLLRVHTDCAR
jgi:hypothetical protein